VTFSSRFFLRIAVLFFMCAFLVTSVSQIHAQKATGKDMYDYIQLGITPIPCKLSGGNAPKCPIGFPEFYSTGQTSSPNPANIRPTGYNDYKKQLNTVGSQTDTATEKCANLYAPLPSVTPVATDVNFIDNPSANHYWAEDSAITALGKSNERARQFLFWTLSRSAIDDNPKIKEIWGVSRNIAISVVILMAGVLGVWMILAQRMRYRLSGEFGVWRSVGKIALSLLYISLSAAIVLLLIQISEIFMRFFILSLGGGQLFNVYFGSHNTEANYIGFIGCRDINIRVQESIDAQVFMLRLTNLTYYTMGIMIILRKILLWFMLFVSPFLPILLSFPLIRNTGKIWIGVFFQWLFYGPLFALFLGATGALWRYGIPFQFDFSRINSYLGYVYPNALIITYGGPAQLGNTAINAFNSANYIDTFAEYAISLIMMWAVIFFPWWLLRIFRDYCCDGIYAMGSALKSLGDGIHPPPPKGPVPQPMRVPTNIVRDTPITSSTKTSSLTQKALRLDNVEQVHQAHTADIASTMGLRATSLRDVARLETNKTLLSSARQNFGLLQNPLTATTSSDRQKYLNVRTELFNRATSKNDSYARYMLSTASTTSQENIQRRSELTKSIEAALVNTSDTLSLDKVVSQSSGASSDRISQVSQQIVGNILNNTQTMTAIAQHSGVSEESVKSILQTFSQQTMQPLSKIIESIAKISNISSDQVRLVLKETRSVIERAQSLANITQITKISDTKATDLLTQISKATITAGAITTSTSAPLAPVVASISTTNNIRQEQAAMSDTDSSSDMQYTKTTNNNINKTTSIGGATSVGGTTSIGDTTSSETSTSGGGGSLFENEKVRNFTQAILKRTLADDTVITTIQTESGLSKKQVESTISIFSTATSIADQQTLEKIKATVGVEPQKALSIIQSAVKQLGSTSNLLGAPGADGGPRVGADVDLFKEQLETAVDPEMQIDQLIPLPEEQSLDEYEEIRNLWVSQYEEGEVPTSEDVHTRLDWIKQDTTIITNILNKFLSKDAKMRQQALDDVGFIIPVFLINNLNGAQLITYLKAKLSAAKQVSKSLIKKKEAEDIAQTESANAEENLVSVDHTVKEENTKHLEVDEEGVSHEAKEVVADNG